MCEISCDLQKAPTTNSLQNIQMFAHNCKSFAAEAAAVASAIDCTMYEVKVDGEWAEEKCV